MIVVNIDKAKVIAHAKRRAVREAEFAPLDDVIAKQIPGVDAAKVEGERRAIRERYAKIQNEIDDANTVDALTSIVNALG